MFFFYITGAQVPVKMMTRTSHEIVTGLFKFEMILPDMKMFLVTLRYSVSFNLNFFVVERVLFCERAGAYVFLFVFFLNLLKI
jgi:hypothetical protein